MKSATFTGVQHSVKTVAIVKQVRINPVDVVALSDVLAACPVLSVRGITWQQEQEQEQRH